MALITGYPLFRAFGDDGSPLVGGLLNTYVAGTTTPKITYSDAAETTPNANPVVLDSRGEALVYLLQDEAYKFVLTDADGAAIVTVDNVGASLLTSTFGVEHNIATGVHEFPGTSAAGDTFYQGASSVVRLALGTAGYVLTAGASAPTWAMAPVLTGVQVYTSGSGNWTVPAGVTKCFVRIWGGGGGGGGSDVGGRMAGGGGGGGGYAELFITGLTPGGTKAYVVGAGGAGALAGGGYNGSNGGTSSFGGVLSATGGAGGSMGSLEAPGSGGAGGTGVGGGGDVGLTGATGSRANADATSGFPGGHGGSAPMGGLGGYGQWPAAGSPGTAPGGGGGGQKAGDNAAASAGAAGLIIIHY